MTQANCFSRQRRQDSQPRASIADGSHDAPCTGRHFTKEFTHNMDGLTKISARVWRDDASVNEWIMAQHACGHRGRSHRDMRVRHCRFQRLIKRRGVHDAAQWRLKLQNKKITNLPKVVWVG